MHWRRKWQPTPVFSPGESQGLQSLVGCRLWGCTESDTTEATWQQQQLKNMGFPGGTVVKIACQCGRSERCRLDPWVVKILWIRKWQHTPVFLPGKFHGQRHLEGCSPRGHTQSNMTELLSGHTHTHTHTHRGKTQPLLPQLSLAPSVKLKSGQFSFPSPLIPLFSPDPFHYHLSPGCPQPPTCLLASKHFPNLSSLISLGIFLNCESDYFTLLIKKKNLFTWLPWVSAAVQGIFCLHCDV